MPISDKHRDQLRQFAPDHLKVVEAMEKMEQEKPAEPTPIRPAAEFTVDMSTLTTRLSVKDMADAEDASGIPFTQMFPKAGASIKAMAAIVWVLRRKDDPTFTYQGAMALSLDELTGAFGKQEDDGAPLEDDASPTM